MNIKNTTAIYFSPTNGTKTCVTTLAQAFDPHYRDLNITDYAIRQQKQTFTDEDLVVLGVPVYGGRIPSIEDFLSNIEGRGTPIICLVCYGNRDYDDALLELKDIAQAQGFVPLACGACIGQHTFTDKLGTARPDNADRQVLLAFAEQIKAKVAAGLLPELTIKGNHPYRTFKPFSFAPVASEACNDCGQCAEICPVQAIDKNDLKNADAQKCLDCYACVRICPQQARRITAPPFALAIQKLEENFSAIRKEPELFL